jgi:uncharacterized membrane protein
MSLPEIVLPKIEIPFDISILMHPPIVHFLIAMPVIVLLLEVLNLMMKKKAVGGVSFLLLVLTMVAAVAAYFTGLTDGKEAYPALTEAAKAALGDHKQLGAYILIGSAVVLVLKLLAMLGNKFLKALYILILIIFLVLLFKQGKEGGELVYTHGVNVKQVKTLDDELFDVKEELEEAQEELAEAQEEAKADKKEVSATVVETPAVVEDVAKTVKTVVAPTTEESVSTTTQKSEAVAESVPTEGVENTVAQ